MKLFLPCLLILISCFTYGQDLVVNKFESPKSYSQYERFNPTIEIKNNGIVNIENGYSIDSYMYLSSDNILSSNDYYLGRAKSHDIYAPGEIKSTSCNECAVNAPPGNYYLIFQLDRGGDLEETDEENNTHIIPGYTVSAPLVDWLFTFFSISSATTTHPHEQVSLNYSIENVGSVDVAGDLGAEFYLSTDQTWSGNDIKVDYSVHYINSSNQIGPVEKKIRIPGSITPGQYYIIGIADLYNTDTDFTETDETNNTISSTSITVNEANIDLQITNIYQAQFLSDPVVTGIQASVQVRNNGTTGIYEYQIKMSLSTDTEIGGDIDLSDQGYFYATQYDYIAPGETRNIFVSMPLLTYPPMGFYHLVLEINPELKVPETNATNNLIISQQPNIIIEPLPDPVLTLNSAKFTGLYDNTDKQLGLTLSFTNTGSGWNSHSYSFNIVIRDGSGVVRYSASEYLSFYLLHPGDSDTETFLLDLNTPLPYGQYDVTISCQSGEYLCSSLPDYHVTLIIDQSTAMLSGTIQGEDGTPIDKGKLFLYQKMDNGKVKFIQKTVPTTSTQFSYAVDNHPHTLYFIPDPVSFPGYAPTIYGKTVILKPSSYITTTQDKTVLLEVLKLDPLATGKMTVTGNVNTGSTSRTTTAREAGESLEDYPVILLSESGEAVALAMTDENGNYEFHNLPAAKYKVVVAFELDQAVMEQPLPVDVTLHNARVDIAVTPQGTLNTVSKSTELISFNAPAVKTFGDQPVALSATSISGLPVNFTSANPAVAEVINNKLIIRGAGTVSIMATTIGNDEFWPATTAQNLTVNKRNQYITFGGIPAMTVNDKSYNLPATASSTLPLTATSDNDLVATVSGLELIITGPGVANITVAQNGNNNFSAALPVTRQLVVNVIMGIEETAGSLRPYPNPTTGLVHLPFKDVVQKIEVADAMGKVHDNISWTNEQIDLSSLNTGVYFIRVQHASAATVFRVIKQ